MALSFLDSLMNSARTLSAGTGAADLGRSAKGAWDGQSTLAKGAIAGGLLGLLLTGGGRRMIGTGVKVGGAAMIGGLAYKAYQDWKDGKAAEAGGPASAPVALAQPDDRFVPSDQAAADDLSRRMLQAMIAAAKADGTVTDEERARITDQLPKLGLGDEAVAMLTESLNTPLDIGQVANLAHSEEEAASIYAASLLVVDPNGAAEKGYLAMLAARLKLAPGLVDHLHANAASLA